MFQAHKNNNQHLKCKKLQKEALQITDHMEDETLEQLQLPSAVSAIQVQLKKKFKLLRKSKRDRFSIGQLLMFRRCSKS